jgi:hypothetical protein
VSIDVIATMSRKIGLRYALLERLRKVAKAKAAGLVKTAKI